MASPPSPRLSNLQISKIRQGSQTDALLPPSFNLASDEVLPTPVPQMNRNPYTAERLQQSLAYCKSFLSQRDISPRAETFMMVFKDEIKMAMAAEKEDQKLAGAGSIRAFELLIQRNVFLSAEVFKKSQKMHENLLELRELQYHARYGDFVRIISSKVRLHASESKTAGWQLLSSRYHWSEISTRFLSYRQFMESGKSFESRSAKDVTDYNTQAAVDNACTELSIDADLARALKTTIRNKINRWFDTSRDPNDINLWAPTQALYAEYQAAKARSGTTKAQKKAANIAENERRSLEKAARQDKSAAGSSSSASKKRTASTDVSRGSKEKSKRDEHKRRQMVIRMAKLETELERLREELAKLDGKAKQIDACT
ncbi:hypothetical protein MMC29_003034 [Sticta canariensis]|nr:hypothetical protein [Sticta canariensis]